MWPFALLVIATVACGGKDQPPFPTKREPCATNDPLKRALFGDLHAHTGFSFDAASYGNALTPVDAYQFARGQTIVLPGAGDRQIRLDRPLDFAAVTDHAEFLGEVAHCTDVNMASYNVDTCQDYRDPENNGAALMGTKLSLPGAARFSDVCGAFDRLCEDAADARWLAMQQAAEGAYDRTAACEFTSFVAYEYTNTAAVSNLHRNVVFASSVVPKTPISMFEAPEVVDLWHALDDQCVAKDNGCDVIVLPHNSNLSNGNLFYPTWRDLPLEEQRGLVELRARMEPFVEVFQHKGDSECRNGFANGADVDPLCEFEKLRAVGADNCGDPPGSGGMRLLGCVHELDFVRNVLKLGLEEQHRLGTNPYHLGFIGSTDTHNAALGYVDSGNFHGHVGTADDTPHKRLGQGTVTHDGVINNPGGLAAVWAEENSRPAIFDALRRRESFATSGPRIELRVFGADGFDGDASCDAEHRAMVAAGYEQGVPMGGVLSKSQFATGPQFIIHVKADRVPLYGIQVVKGWVDGTGQAHERVIDVERFAADPIDVDTTTCAAPSDGWSEHCATYHDASWGQDDEQAAFYYVRVVEQPTCRWSTLECNRMAEEEKPDVCSDGSVPASVQHRAWSSPIYVSD